MNQKCLYRRDFHNYEATSEGRYLPGDDYVLARAGDMPNIRRAVHHYEAMSKGQYLPVDVYMLTCVGDSFKTKRTIRHLPENDGCRLSERKQIIPAKPIVELLSTMYQLGIRAKKRCLCALAEMCSPSKQQTTYVLLRLSKITAKDPRIRT
ncbi:uncharacterized protein F5891DRAFT_1172005 [Suillus fuscotomentosus]|uniref:Uncharacterized protein n=1 Tax=Suillus fuscotomentosus TaxID=1912939 RepID=A0AAD4EB37_9AGAM|nr:uncharacterized protein F5891DRAFT_1172005 [Suillus fuscotomentosus]KAG1902702.1 hypothetical protein F5891DRAFT_1172005 [Suillus fuscotomentosus]